VNFAEFNLIAVSLKA